MRVSAQATSNGCLNVRLILLGMCFFCLCLSGLVSHAETTKQASAQKHYMLWPLLPGETLQSLASQLYPQSPILQQRFIQQAIALSRHHSSTSVSPFNLTADTQFNHPQLIAVPHEQALTALTHRIKKAEELVAIQNQTASPNNNQPFSDHRLSFQLSTNSTLTTNSTLSPQQKNIRSAAEQAETDTSMPKIVFEETAESKQDSQATTVVEKQELVVATPAPISTSVPNPVSEAKAPPLHRALPAQAQTKSSLKIGTNWQTARANLQANLRAFKQGNVHDWLRHPQLKWLCLEGLVLILLVLYALIEVRLKRRASQKDISLNQR